MAFRSRSRTAAALTATGTALALLAAPAAASASPVVVHQGQVTRQDVPSRAGSEPDTVVEPSVAVSPRDPDVAVAAAHDSRYADGGAVDISLAWTDDGGATWHHQPSPHLTIAVGGQYERASDGQVAFGPDGTAYMSALAFDASTCRSAVTVQRSTDGGRTWSPPSFVRRDNDCGIFNDKNWLVVDNSPASPHHGRVYQFWTRYRYNSAGQEVGAPQSVRWSDDHGRTWSTTHYVGDVHHDTQNSQPMITADGSIVDTYYDYGSLGTGSDDDPHHRGEAVANRSATATVNAFGTIYAATSTDGGATWSTPTEVVNNAGGYADGVRCCLFSGTIDRSTGVMYLAFHGGVADTDPVYETFSTDGTHWSSPIRVTRGDVSGVQRVNVAVAALAGKVYVTYGTRTDAASSGGYVQQQISQSSDGGYTFGAPTSIGPRSTLKYAAQAGGYFPGDYIGLAISPGRLYGVWAVSSKPPAYSTSPYHQVIYGATLRI